MSCKGLEAVKMLTILLIVSFIEEWKYGVNSGVVRGWLARRAFLD